MFARRMMWCFCSENPTYTASHRDRRIGLFRETSEQNYVRSIIPPVGYVSCRSLVGVPISICGVCFKSGHAAASTRSSSCGDVEITPGKAERRLHQSNSRWLAHTTRVRSLDAEQSASVAEGVSAYASLYIIHFNYLCLGICKTHKSSHRVFSVLGR